VAGPIQRHRDAHRPRCCRPALVRNAKIAELQSLNALKRSEATNDMDVESISTFSPESLRPGTKSRRWLDVFPDVLSATRLPLLVARGAEPGPLFLVVAGVHGDEYEGMEAIRGVLKDLDPGRMRGTFLAIPVANPFAYEARARVTPLHLDGLNLARVFPGDPTSSVTRRLAAALLDFVTRLCGPDDLFLDFHSGSADVPFASMVGVRNVPGAAHERAKEAARHFGLDRLWLIPDGPGPFNAETARRGIVTLGTETTGRAGCDPDDVADYVRGLWNLLGFLQISDQKADLDRKNHDFRNTLDVLAPASGFLRSVVRNGQDVSTGDCLGEIVDVFDAPVRQITAPSDGTIWAARSMPPVRTGELMYMIALP
jgi:uncharacterized protein